MLNISHRANAIKPSPTLKVAALANEMRAKGVDVINFGAGEPDFNTPDYIKEEAKLAIDNNFTHYTKSSGIIELRKAIADKFKKDNGLEYDPENILVSPGAKASLINVLMTIIDPRDEVLIPCPYWVSYTSQVEFVDAHPVMVESNMSNGFKVTPAQIDHVIGTLSNPKALILNSPNNPTGAVYSKEELEKIAEVCLKHDIFIISDEIYERLIYDDAEHVSIASLSDEMKKMTVVINGLSKAYAMTGWRLGYSAGPEEIMKRAIRIQSHTTSCVNSITQKAAVVALQKEDGSVEKMRKAFSKRRDFLIETLNKIDQVKCAMPKGAFYAMPDVSYYLDNNDKGIQNTMELCQYLLKEYKVATVPGSAFGAEGYARFSYAASMENIKEGVHRFVKGLQSLR